MLLLHGGGQTRHSWGGAAEALAARGYEAWLLDLRGHGDSDWAADGDYSTEAMVEDLAAVRDHIGRRPVVVGASMGGLVGLLSEGKRHPGGLRALVLVDIATKLEDEGVDRIVSFMSAAPDGFASLEDAADTIASYRPDRPRPRNLAGLRKNLRLGDDGRWRWHWDPAFLAGKSRQDRRNPDALGAAASALRVPTLLVRGRLSDMLSHDGVEVFRRQCPHADFVDIADAGHMGYDAGIAALDDAGLDFPEVGVLYNGYLGGQIGLGVRIAKDLGLTGIPVTHVENASATGSCAFGEAVHAVAGGRAEVAMALGFDDMNRMGGIGGGRKRRLGAEDVMLPAAFFAMWATRRMHDVGTTVETYAAIAAKNWNHARTNPMAQRRADHAMTVEEVLASTLISYPHNLKMACAAGGGAAAAIVATEDVARRLGGPMIRVCASQQRSETYTDGHVFLGAVIGPAQMTRDTAAAAYEQAGLGPADLDLVQVHDAFPVEELVYYELLGICADGEGDKLVAEGETSLGARIPFSTDGGLTARGHPGGPTGLAQIHETVVQLRGDARDRQVDGARTGLCHMAGAGSVCVVHILQRA